MTEPAMTPEQAKVYLDDLLRRGMAGDLAAMKEYLDLVIGEVEEPDEDET